ncbi:MAG: alpha-2-macroglobulin family protein [Myxococcota bacterium]|nr:alpha-2-macroglobulin family protein [Myxococcota bacterium]
MYRFNVNGLVVLLALGMGACGPQSSSPPESSSPLAGQSEQPQLELKAEVKARLVDAPEEPYLGHVDEEGLSFRISDAEPAQTPRDPRAVAKAEELSNEEADALLARLPEMEPASTASFAMREGSLKPPLSGSDTLTPFPPAEQLPPPKLDDPKSRPLRVLRYRPEGSVDLAPKMSITFSEPMVALSSIDTVAREQIPVQLEPRIEGEWRWLDTRTLQFVPKVRLPMATEYTATVKKGVKSANGNVLEDAVSWRFDTPPLRITSYVPSHEAVNTDPVLFFAFNQRIDPAAVLAKMSIEGDGKPYALRLTTANDVLGDDVEHYIKNSLEGTWLTAKFTAPIPKDTRFGGVLEVGAPSAEGPRLTTEAQIFRFKTYGPLRVQDARCSNWQCVAGEYSGFHFYMTNPLDQTKFDAKMVTVEPALENQYIEANGQYLTIGGTSKPNTQYVVTLSSALTDIYQQQLEGKKEFRFNMIEAEPYPYLQPSYDQLVVLEPNAERSYSFMTVAFSSLEVKMYRMKAEDYLNYQLDFVEKFYSYDQDVRKLARVPGELVETKSIPIADRRKPTLSSIDLSPALSEGIGHVVLVVTPHPQPADQYYIQAASVWIQASRLGLTVAADRSDLVAWVSDLATGQSMKDVDVEVAAQKLRTGEDGLGRGEYRGSDLAIARKGTDSVFLPPGAWQLWAGHEDYQHLWYVMDDRHLYKPKETVNIKGFVRSMNLKKGGDLELLTLPQKSVSYIVRDPQWNELHKGTARLSELGGFDFKFTLPDNANLGWANVELVLDEIVYSGRYNHSFRIEEFRRPEFEVQLAPDDAVAMVGEHKTVGMSASYFAGGPLPDAETSWIATAMPAFYTPPNRSDYVFGEMMPWWYYRYYYQPSSYTHHQARTDVKGMHRVRLDFDQVKPRRPMSLTLEANVSDVNRQTWASSTSMIVHPSSLYLGLRAERSFVEKGEVFDVDVIVTEVDGKLVVGKQMEVSAIRLEWRRVDGSWTEMVVERQLCTAASAEGRTRCRFEAREGGTYLIEGKVEDDKGRGNRSAIAVWVSGGDAMPDRSVSKDTVLLIPDKNTYAPGETAEVLVQAPWYPAEGMLTVRRSGMVKSERFSMSSASHTLRIPIEDEHVPGLNIQVNLVGAAQRRNEQGEIDTSLPPRPAYASGWQSLSIPPRTRSLQVLLTPRETVLPPGSESAVDVEIFDAAGKPVSGAEVVLVAVDEAVLSLAGYQLLDPLASFYPSRSDDTTVGELRAYLMLGDPAALIDAPGMGYDQYAFEEAEMSADFAPPAEAQMRSAPSPVATAGRGGGMKREVASKSAEVSGGERSEGGDGAEIALRQNFDALAFFVPNSRTDANGRVEVAFKLPDNLTRYRIMAVAAAGAKQFGKGESSLTARLDLMARPSAPRFLNFGDEFELPIVIQNLSDVEKQVQVALRASNAELPGARGLQVKVAANDRVELRFPAKAALPGTARFQVATVSGSLADAADITLPVWTPATSEAFAIYGEIDDGAIVQPVKAPKDVVPEFGGLEVSTSSTAVAALTDAVLYLHNYPFDCTEQIASKVLGIVSLRDVLAAFEAEGLPSASELEASISEDLRMLKSRQHWTGGFAYWGGEPVPYVSIHAAHAIVRAKLKGYEPPGELWQNAKAYLDNIEQRIADYESRLGYRLSEAARASLKAYAYYVLAASGEYSAERAAELLKSPGIKKLSLETLGWMLYAMAKGGGHEDERVQILKHFANRVEETAAAATFVGSYGEDENWVLLYSDRRSDAVVLESLIEAAPKDEIIAKVVRGLLAHRRKGHWGNTQENSLILVALERYFATYESVTPDFVARVWLGEGYAGEQEYRGRSTERQHLNIPMATVLEGPSEKNLVLQKGGAGRLYYRIGMRYAPKDLQLEALDRGFIVDRVYEAVDEPTDVSRDADGVWRIKLGATVRVKLSMVNTARRYHVALVDPLPAGLEATNPALAMTGGLAYRSSMKDDNDDQWWRSYWYEHQNLRDERVEAFTSLLWAGEYSYSYLARATTPGSFVVPPTKAEEMYSPETFGRNATARVIIE